jgi:hypothetical protein
MPHSTTTAPSAANGSAAVEAMRGARAKGWRKAVDVTAPRVPTSALIRNHV